ncbi:Tetracenomycin C resistance and export protein [Frankia canadensis]|uniref:Tetracenomycin C resistance and export protein n=1 Tax=Frankia canadensis TaxID=1836972 RepID=A0A2I2KJ26_9ACTN|nr:Tetracenomycin C resistance and export protein [Frankia canadensis]SOU52962.1 Tetracenomycin C resistance and export protein [Frankia canadensis]
MTLVSVALGVIMVGLDATVVSIANPRIAEDLHASLSDLQWVTNSYLLALAVLLIPAGKLGDRFGRRRIFLIGVVGFALTSLGVGLVGSITGVIVFRALQGVAGALLMPNTLAILRSAFPPEKLNMAIGVWGGASAISIAAGPIIGGLLVEHVSWESVFIINIPVGAVALVVGLLVLAESRDESGPHHLDVPGLLTLAGGLFALVFGMIKAQSWGWDSGRTIGFLVAAAVLLVAFVLIESRVRAPLVPMRLFRNRSLSLSTLIVVLTFLALFGVLFFLTLYLQNVHGYSAVQAGVRTLPLSAVFMVSSPLGAALNARFGPRVPIAAGMTLLVGAFVLLTQLEPDSSYHLLWPAFVAIGVGVGLTVTAASDAIVGNAPVADSGVAGGLQSTATQLGGVLGTAILGSVLASRVGSVLGDRLVAAGVPAAQAERLTQAKEAVGQGLVPPVPGASDALRAAVESGSHAAFMSGLHVSMVIGAALSAVALLLALLIRPGENAGSGVVHV